MATMTIDSQISTAVSKFVSAPRKLLIDGKWVEAASGERFPVYNPATGVVLAQVAEADAEDVNRAVRAAQAGDVGTGLRARGSGGGRPTAGRLSRPIPGSTWVSGAWAA